MLTFTCPNCGTVTTVGKEAKPYMPDMEMKLDGYDLKTPEQQWRCKKCSTGTREVFNLPSRLTCRECGSGRS